MKRIFLSAAAVIIATAAQAGTQTISVYEDQDASSLGAGFSAPNGGVFVDGTQGYGGLPASNGKSFGSNLLRLTGDGQTYPGSGVAINGSTLNITLTGLQQHDSISLDFLLAAIDSLDGNATSFGPDQITISVDGSQIFSSNYANCVGQNQVAPTSNRIAGPTNLGFNQSGPCYYDSAYDMGMLSAFHNIAHTGSSLLLTFQVSGMQDSSDESYGIDALSVTLNGTPDDVPEPAMLGLFGMGAIGLGLARRRRA